MYKVLERQRQLCHIAEQLMIFLQIISLILIVVVSLCWFFELIGNDTLHFMAPSINVIKVWMEAWFAEQLHKGKSGIEGSLFIFIVLMGCVLYICSQIKIFFKFQKKSLDKAIIKAREAELSVFNKQLQEDAKRQIMEYKNIIFLINISLKSLLKDVYQTHNDVKRIDKKQEEIVLIAFYNMLKALPGYTFSKDGKTLIISSKRFESVDTLMLSVDQALSTLRAQLEPRKLTIVSNMAIDVFPGRVQLKDVYADLKTLLQLNMPNEILCYGNFCNRYEHVKNPHFEPYLKGTYDITDEENVWSLIKKS